MSEGQFRSREFSFNNSTDGFKTLQGRGFEPQDESWLRVRGTDQTPSIIKDGPDSVDGDDIPQDESVWTKGLPASRIIREALLHLFHEIKFDRVRHIHANFRGDGGAWKVCN